MFENEYKVEVSVADAIEVWKLAVRKRDRSREQQQALLRFARAIELHDRSKEFIIDTSVMWSGPREDEDD